MPGCKLERPASVVGGMLPNRKVPELTGHGIRHKRTISFSSQVKPPPPPIGASESTTSEDEADPDVQGYLCAVISHFCGSAFVDF